MEVYDLEAMARTNIEINESLIRRVMKMYGLKTKRQAVDYALKRVAGHSDPRDILQFRGVGWEGDLAEMRRFDPPPWD